VDGQFEYTGTLAVYKSRDDIFHAYSKSRYRNSAEIKTEESVDIIKILPSACYPLFRSIFKAGPDPLPNDYYIKRPALISYD